MTRYHLRIDAVAVWAAVVGFCLGVWGLLLLIAWAVLR